MAMAIVRRPQINQDKYNIKMDKEQRIMIKKIDNYIFKFSDLLGQGNFSKVYKAKHEITNETVAIKVIQLNSLKSPKLQELLLSEIDVLKKLKHQNILRCFEVFTSNRNCYIITQFCNQGDLDQILRKKGKFTQQEALPYIKDVFHGLLYLAENHIIHRDLKVANIFIHDNVAKIADFGFAQLSKVSFKDINVGSPLYMSPEGLIHNLYGEKTDIWAFGILMFELLHGLTPHAYCKTQHELRQQLLVQLTENSLAEQLSKPLKQVIIACLQVKEEKRPTMAELKNYEFFQRIKSNSTFVSLGCRKLSSQKLNFRTSINSHYSSQKGKTTTLSTNKNGVKSTNFPSQTERVNFEKVTKKPLQIETQPRVRFHSVNRNQKLFVPIQNQIREGRSPITPTSSKKWERKSSFNFFQGILTFKQCINLLHYCRLIYKYVMLVRQTQFLLSDCERVLSFWIFRIINAIGQKLDTKQIHFEENSEVRQSKMKEVLNQYEKRYAADLEKPIVLDTNFQSLEVVLRKRCSEMEMVEKVRKDIRYIQMLHFLIIMIEGTGILGKCWSSKNYKPWREYRRIESFLSRQKQTMTHQSFSDLKNQIW